jgi:hypothetical protein
MHQPFSPYFPKSETLAKKKVLNVDLGGKFELGMKLNPT